MNEQAINDLYEIAKQNGYSKSRDEFVSLLHTNENAFNDMYSLAQSNGYQKSQDDFAVLVGKKKSEPISEQPQPQPTEKPQQAQGAAQAAQAKPATALPSGVSSSALPSAETPEERGLTLLTPEFGKKVAEQEKTGAFMGSQMKQPTMKVEPLPPFAPSKSEDDFNASLEEVNKDLMDYDEDYIVTNLNYLFGKDKYGFEFNYFRDAREAVEVKAPNGKTMVIPVDAFTEKGDVESAEQFKKFLDENKPKLAKLSDEYNIYQSTIKNEQDMKKATESMNAETMSLNKVQQELVLENNNLEKELKYLQSVPQSERGSQDYINRVDEYNKRKTDFSANLNNASLMEKDISAKQSQLYTSIGRYTSMRAEQGGFLGGLYNSLLGGYSSMGAAATGIATDVIMSLPLELTTSPKDIQETFTMVASSKGVEVPANMNYEKFQQWSQTLDEETKSEINSEVKDYLTKRTKGEMIPSIRKGLVETIGAKGTTPEYIEDAGLIKGGIYGLAGSLPAMSFAGAGPAGTMSAFFLQGYDATMKEMESEEFKGVSENEKYLVALPVGIVSAALEEFGMRNVFAKSGLVNDIVAKALSKSGAKTSATTFKQLVENEVESRVARGALVLTAAGLAEAETGAAQAAAEIGIKEIYNTVKGKDMFKTPETVGELIKEVFVAGAQEAIGGVTVSSFNAVATAYGENNFNGVTNETLEIFSKLANDDNARNAYAVDLKMKVVKGEITAEQGKKALDDLNNSISVYNSIPDNLAPAQQRQAFSLLRERKGLEAEIDGKDEALVKKQRERINEINEELSNLPEAAPAEAAPMEAAPVEDSKQKMEKELRESLPYEYYESILDSEFEWERRNAKEFLEDPKAYFESNIEIAKRNLERDPDDKISQNVLDDNTEKLRVFNEITNRYKDAIQKQGKPAEAALKDVESTAKALDELSREKRLYLQDLKQPNINKEVSELEKLNLPYNEENKRIDEIYEKYKEEYDLTISEAYHKAKKDRTNPELVQAVEDLLTPKTQQDAIQKPSTEEGVLRAEQPQVGLQEVGQRDKGQEAAQAPLQNQEIELTQQINELEASLADETQQEITFGETTLPRAEAEAKLEQLTTEREAVQFEASLQEEVSSRTPEQIGEYNPSDDVKEKDMDVLGFVLSKKKIIPEAEPEITDFGDTVTIEYYDPTSEQPIVTRLTFKKNKDGSISKSGVKIDKSVPPIRSTKYYSDFVKSKTPTGQGGVSVSNKSQLKTLATKTTDKVKSGVIAAASRAVNTLKSVFPDMDIVIHETEESYLAAGGPKGSRGSFTYSKDSNGKVVGGVVNINLSSANATTVPHEVAHAVMLKAFGDNPALFKRFRDRINTVLADSTIAKLDDFASEYNETDSHEEYLVQLSAVLSATEKQLPIPDSIVQRIAELINKVVSRATNGLIVPFKGKVETKQLIEFLNTMSSSIAKGQEVQVAEAKGEGGVAGITTKEQISVKDIDVKEIRTKSRSGKRVSKGLSIKTKDKIKVVEEAEDLSLDYVKKNAPEVFISNAKIIADYPIVSGIKKFTSINSIEDAQKVYDIFSRQVADNLKYLMENFRQDLKDIATLWYDGANILAQNFSKKYGITTEQAAGIIASLSPQKDWYQNVRLAEMVMMAFKENPVMTKKMVEKQKEIVKTGLKEYTKDLNKAKLAYKKSRSKANAEALKKEIKSTEEYIAKTNIVLDNLNKLIGTDMNSAPDYMKQYFVRLFHEINTTKDYDILSPDGKVIGVAKKKNGTKAKVAWGSYTEIGKAVSIYLDGSQENITKTLGEMHKIRNFYNNIIDPMSPDRDVTMDTHAVAAALLLPLSGQSKQVKANFGTGTSNSAPLGIKGLYYAFAEGYNLAAKETGLLPRQVQSITWEAVRGLFTDDFKRDRKKVAYINAIVDNYKNKKITLDEARNQITEYAGGIKDPTWAGGPLQEESTGDVEARADGRRGKKNGPDTIGTKRGGAGGLTTTTKEQKGNEAEAIVKQGRANGVSENAIRSVLSRRGFTAEEIDAAMAKPKAGKKIELSEELMQGYDKMMADIDAVIESGLNRKAKQETILNNVLKKVRESEAYKNGTDIQKEEIEREVKKAFGEKMKSAPKVETLLGGINSVDKITIAVRDLVANQIKSLARGAKDAKKAWMKASDLMSKDLKDMVASKKISAKQAAAVIKRFSKVDMFNETSVENFVNYMAKVFADAEYDEKIAGIKSKLKTAKKNIYTKLGISKNLVPLLDSMLAINPTLVPDSVFDTYVELVDMLSKREAVLSLQEVNTVTEKTEKILDAINKQESVAAQAYQQYLGYAEKVIKDGEVDFAATVKKMVENNLLTEAEAEILRKYKNRLMEREGKKKTEDEIAQERKQLFDALDNVSVTPEALPSRIERDAAAELIELAKSDAVQGLDNIELNNLLKALDNIANGYFPHQAQLLIERLNAINRSKTLATAEIKAKPLAITKVYASLKSLVTRNKTALEEMIRRSPLKFIDQVFGDFKTNAIFKSLFEPISSAYGQFASNLKRVENRLDDAYNNILKSHKGNPLKTLMSSYKITAYMIQNEFDSNKGSKQVNKASDFLKATIKQIYAGESHLSEKNAQMLQEVLDWVNTFTDADGNVDTEAMLKSMSKAERDAIGVVRDINDSLTEKAMFTASVIRGEKIKPLNNYIHLQVMKSSINPENNTVNESDSMMFSDARKPSSKAKNLVERTGDVSPINFDIFSSAQRGARFVLLDYHMTPAIRTARKTLAETKKSLENEDGIIQDKKTRQVNSAINNVFEEVLKNTLSNTFTVNSFAEEVVDYISRTGYRAVLAGVPRFASELTSNMAFATIIDPESFSKGFKLRGVSMSAVGADVMLNLGSGQVTRIYSNDPLTGRLIDTQIMSQSGGKRMGKANRDVANKLQQIYNNTLGKYKNSVEFVADTLIATPDKIVMRSMWFGSFAKEFKKITGVEPDFDKIASKDEAYMNQYKDALKESTSLADEKTVLTASTDNPFMGILKGAPTPNQNGFVKAFNIFNNYMTRFLIYEYMTARMGVMAAMGNGYLTKKQGAAMLGAVLTRMTVYTFLMSTLTQLMVGLFVDEEEEDDEKSLLQKFGQSFTSAVTGLLLGRDFGNATKSIINYGIELGNQEFLDFLREGEYDPYKDAIAFTPIPVEPIKKDGEKGGAPNRKGLYDYLINMTGPFAPALKSADLVVRKAFEEPKKTPEALRRQELEKYVRIPLEVLGNIGLVPLYKDVRKVTMKAIYKDLDKAKSETKKEYDNPYNLGKEDMKRYYPDEYDKYYGPKSINYKTEQIEKKINKQIDDIERKIKDDMYNYVPKKKENKKKD